MFLHSNLFLNTADDYNEMCYAFLLFVFKYFTTILFQFIFKLILVRTDLECISLLEKYLEK